MAEPTLDDDYTAIDQGRTLGDLAVGDSPLAHALRRRRHEIEHPEIPVIAGHDSCLT